MIRCVLPRMPSYEVAVHVVSLGCILGHGGHDRDTQVCHARAAHPGTAQVGGLLPATWPDQATPLAQTG